MSASEELSILKFNRYSRAGLANSAADRASEITGYRWHMVPCRDGYRIERSKP